MVDATPSALVNCECCGTSCPEGAAVEYWQQSLVWPDNPRQAVYYCQGCNVECHGLGEDCKILERLDHARYAWERRPVTDEEMSEVREMVERSVRRSLNLNVRLNSEEE